MMKNKICMALTGIAISALVVAGILFDPYTPETAPEHYGQVEYCGVWLDYADYTEMLRQREAYLAAQEAAEELSDLVLTAVGASVFTQIETENTNVIELDADERYLLTKISMAEMEGEDVECKALAICVVLNRVASDSFPDSISDVIYQSNGNVWQFTSVGSGRFDAVEPDEECYEALDMVMNGWDESQAATFFELTGDAPTWHSRNLERLFEHCSTTFYKEEE